MNLPLTKKAGYAHVVINQKKNQTIPLADIVMCEGIVNYTLIYMRNGRKIVTAHTLKSFEISLNETGFNRVHRKYLINNQHCIGFDRDNSSLRMGNGMIIAISRRRLSNFLKY
jgi:two-component system, LytTR family, response regulator